MYQHILVPVDLSKGNYQTLKTAVQLAEASKGRISLVHVIATIQHLDFEESKDFFAAIEEKAKTRLKELMEPWSDSDVAIHAEIRYGKPVKEIVLFAIDHDCELIVLGSHKADTDDLARGFGSVSQQVAFFAQTPVLLVK